MKDIIISGIVGLGIGVSLTMVFARNHLFSITKRKDQTIEELQERNKVLEEENMAINGLNETNKNLQEELTVIVDVQTLKLKNVMRGLDASMERFHQFFINLHDHYDQFINNLENAPMDDTIKGDLMTEAIQIHQEIDNFLPSPYEYVTYSYLYFIGLLAFIFIIHCIQFVFMKSESF